MSNHKRLPDQDARDLIESRLDQNLLVEAGAGSGKTESLARRMAAGIVEGRYMVEHMAAVTFTRKAAAELRGRFQLVLEARLTEETDPTRRMRIEQALTHLERLFAGTIHAFCAHLIRERPVEAGVAPGFAELDEGQDMELRNRIWREFIDLERANGSALLEELIQAGIMPHQLDEAFGRVCTFADVEFPPGEASKPDPTPAHRGFERFWAELNTVLPGEIPLDPRCELQATARETMGRLRVTNLNDPREMADLLSTWERHPHMTQKYWPGTLKERKERKARLDALIEDFQTTTVRPYLGAWRQYVYRLAVTLLQQGRAHLAAARRAALALNYEDLLQIAATLLRENADVRADLQEKYRWLFVDEFQDTDPIQAEVILLLAAQPGASGRWTEIALRPGSLFIVGDPKQSIYRFRRADIDTYQRVRQHIEETGGRVVVLTGSWRAVPQLCDWANTVFERIFPRQPTPQQPAFHGLHPVCEDGHDQGWGVRTLTIPADLKESQIPETETEQVAAFIRAEVDAGRRKPGDFLVLTRKKRALGRYAAALEALHLPVAVSGASAFAESRAVETLVGLLRALADPDDGPAVIGVLRGPLFGLSDQALFDHRQAGARFLLTAPIPENRSGPAVEALRSLQSMYVWTRTLPAPPAIERILEVTGLLPLAAAETPGGAEGGALFQAVDLVRQTAESGGSLTDAVRTLEETLESAGVETVPLEPGQRDVVRVMNLHKAKGLEAPVVFLADPLGGVNAQVDLRIVRDGTRALGYLRLMRPVGDWSRVVIGEPADWEAHEAAELAYVTAEESRLLYVACTRAMKLLVITRWAKDGGRGTRPWGALEGHIETATPLTIPSAQPPRPAPLPDVSPEVRLAAQREREERHRHIITPSWRVDTVTALNRHSGSAGQRDSSAMRVPDSGLAWGKLVHGLLEHAMRKPDLDRAALERLATWLIHDDPELSAAIPAALDTVEAVKSSEFWREAMAADERLVEVPFCVRIVDASLPRLLSGVVDLLYKTGKGWHLIDYKTDQASIDELCQHYGDQVRQYAAHWAQLTGEECAYAGIFAVRHRQLSPDLRGTG